MQRAEGNVFERPPEEIAEELKNYILQTAYIEMSRFEFEERVQDMAFILGQLNENGKLGRVLEILLRDAKAIPPHGQHEYQVLVQEGELRKGPLVAFETIPPGSGRNEEHTHPLGAYEAVIGLRGSPLIVVDDTYLSLIPFDFRVIYPGASHTTVNPSHERAQMLILRNPNLPK